LLYWAIKTVSFLSRVSAASAWKILFLDNRVKKYIEEEFELANHKSALKRNRQSQLRRERNRTNRSKVKTVVKKIEAAIEVDGSVEKAREALVAAIPVIERAAVKGAFHKRTAARKISRLTKKVGGFANSKESAA